MADCPKHVEQVLEKYQHRYKKHLLTLLRKICHEPMVYESIDPLDNVKDERMKKIIAQEHYFRMEEYNDFYHETQDKIKETKNGTPIYRGLIVKDYPTFKKHLSDRKIGDSWTWDKDCARPSGNCKYGMDKDLVILKGIQPSKIDDDTTYMINLIYDNREKEIRLGLDSTILVEEVCHHEADETGNLKEVCNKIGKRFKV